MTALADPPQGWRLQPLGSVGTVVTGSTPPTGDRSNYGHEYMFVSPADMGRHKYVKTTGKMLSRRGFLQSRRIPKGSTLFVCIGSTIGKVGLTVEEVVTNQQINAIIPGVHVDAEYLYYAALTLSSLVRERAGEQAVPLVNKSEFSTFEILLPPKQEQVKIARTLSEVDELVATLERLIVKKKTIRQGILQQLLTGRTRLPGFAEAWISTTVGAITEIVGGGTPARGVPAFWGGPIPWATIKDISTFNPHGTQEYITPDALRASATRLIAAGTPVLAARMLVGKAVRFKVDVAINQDLKALLVGAVVDPSYLCHWFDVYGPSLAASAGGSTVAGTSTAEIRKLPIDLPQLNEQRAIAAVLDSSDDEIGLLRVRMEKARDVRMGMMQQLLTGRSRLPLESL